VAEPTPSTLPDRHRAFIATAIEVLSADARVVGIAAAGSYADNAMDEFSDLDLIVAAEPDQHCALLQDRQRVAAQISPLLTSFTGEHVGEPRLLICLYGPPLLHVDLKFVLLQDAATRVEDPIVLWERASRLTAALAQREARYPCPDLQWVEDRFWVWIHYMAGKVGRGEIFEVLEGLSFLRFHVFGPLGKRQLGLRPAGVRRLEATAPQLARELTATVAAPDVRSVLAAIRASVALYRRLRSVSGTALRLRLNAETSVMQYLADIEKRYAN
jgi:predicted nucleotidyltransferase